MKRIIRQTITILHPVTSTDFIFLTTAGSERYPPGLTVAVQKRGVHSFWSTSAQTGQGAPDRAQLVTQACDTDLLLQPGDSIELAFDPDNPAAQAGYAALIRDGRQFATAIAHSTSKRAVPYVPAEPWSVEQIEAALEHEQQTRSRAALARLGRVPLACPDTAQSAAIRTTFGHSSVTQDDLERAMRTAEQRLAGQQPDDDNTPNPV